MNQTDPNAKWDSGLVAAFSPEKELDAASKRPYGKRISFYSKRVEDSHVPHDFGHQRGRFKLHK